MLKRTFDIVVSLVCLCLCLPLFLLVMVIIKVESWGPVFYRGRRSGLHGRPFMMLKFRTMVEDAEKKGGHSTSLDDPRLTRIGRALRKFKLDELPQFINVLKGDMSIVGPRPQVEYYTSLYVGEEKTILNVKPGLTDYASIRFIDMDSTLGREKVDEKYKRDIEPEKNRLRIQYVREASFLTDMKILFKTMGALTKVFH